MPLEFVGRGWLCSKCSPAVMESMASRLPMFELQIIYDQELFDATSPQMLPEGRDRMARELTRSRNAYRRLRATFDRMSALASWQEKANEADDPLPEEHRTISAQEEAFLVRVFSPSVLHSSTRIATAFRKFESLRLIRDILDPGWRNQYATIGSLNTLAELEYWDARNQSWRQQRVKDILDAGVTNDPLFAKVLEIERGLDICYRMRDVAHRAMDMLRMRKCARRFERRRERKVSAWNIGR